MANAMRWYCGARLNRFESQLLAELARREKLTSAEMIRQCIIREACRPLFGAEPISEVMVDAAD